MKKRWGGIEENWSLVHFLLKYRYVDNWEREVNENYLSLSLDNFFKIIPSDYSPIDFKHYTLPFIRKEIHNTFDIDFQESTHVQIILEKK